MVVKIIIMKDDKPIDQVIMRGNSASIGRKSDCDISIKDPAVSGNHAQLKKTRDGYLIEDLGSTNGLHLAGQKISQKVLKNEDVVTIGEHQLRFLFSDADAGENQSTENAAEGGYLKVINGANTGDRIELKEALTSIGEPGVQVAAVSKRPKGHYIIHVDGGKNKDKVPLVNGEPTGFKSRKLEPGDIIEVAGIQMEYCV
ncbi:MAG: FHA domain-containing protein [Proteobacteria bacterium]|nr:FHA domain-containing protein [Pseudomonadota bacterium]